ncbi:ROK family protein [Haploplasma axanthum]|uniref:ROK family sugar kinase n=1 Tax=Haploplasma axanthum TaxID=29552 RepID=A0A449BBQ8_HAPAX|nr:ROK family protein [Haploplasma axanthum]VEU79862.1 ROK family sugar kinase [Haploplasma axanthum]
MIKTSNSQSVKIENMRLVMEKIVELREVSRIELSRLTTLNKATVSSIMSEFVSSNLVIKTDKIIKTSGRSANLFALNKNAGRIISIELLTNSLYGVITNLYGEILYEVVKEDINPEFTPYLKVLLETIDHLRENTYESTYGLIGIGIGVYGTLSNSKKIKYAPFNSWKDIDLKEIIEDYTGIKTYVENEANISALGEKIVNRDQKNIVSLNIGLGVGMGIVIDSKLYTGEHGYAGEIGHTIIVPNGRKCVCGNHGCLETYISNKGITNYYYELTNQIISLNDFISLYQKRDTYALKVFDMFTDYVAIAINNISQTIDPHTIIINSKIADSIPETISAVKNKLKSSMISLDVLSTSKFKSKTNILGLTHILIQDFLNVDNYSIKNLSKI